MSHDIQTAITALLPLAVSAFGPYVTKFLCSVMGKLPGPVATLVSAIAGAIIAWGVSLLFPGGPPAQVTAALGALTAACSHLSPGTAGHPTSEPAQ